MKRALSSSALAVLLVVSKGSSPTNPQPEPPTASPPAPAVVAPVAAEPKGVSVAPSAPIATMSSAEYSSPRKKI